VSVSSLPPEAHIPSVKQDGSDSPAQTAESLAGRILSKARSQGSVQGKTRQGKPKGGQTWSASALKLGRDHAVVVLPLLVSAPMPADSKPAADK
jgi:hypothetical protein